jgi:hypothetical protein
MGGIECMTRTAGPESVFGNPQVKSLSNVVA